MPERPAAGKQSGAPAAVPTTGRTGKSGEGASSALEQLIQQEKKRLGQLPGYPAEAERPPRER